MGTDGDVQELLEDRPDLEPAVKAVLDADSPFEFDDLGLDSGDFGELVAAGIVEKNDGGYRIPDPNAVRRGLSGGGAEHAGDRRGPVSGLSIPVSPQGLVFLFGALSLVVGLRLLPLPTVYHEGHVVLSSNDPYYYRYLVEQLLNNPEVTPWNLGFVVSKGEPLLVTTLWFAALLLGGTAVAGGHVLAWYPIASALVSAVLVYSLAVVVTEDRRIGLASVALLAVIPGHAYRTSLGFADHHPFDYLWLVITLLGITITVRETGRGFQGSLAKTIAGVAVIAIGIAGQTLAWDNSPIILAAVGGYLALEGLRVVNSDTRPFQTVGPVCVGIGLGSALTWLAHDGLGWHTLLVASAPTLLALAGLGVLAGGELVDWLDLPSVGTGEGFALSIPALAALEGIGIVVGMFVLRAIRPEYWTRLTTSLHDRLLAPRQIAEVQGLFSDAGGWLLLLGFALFLGVPYLIWATTKTRADGRWLPSVVFTWYFLLLSVTQVRFVGELAIPLSLFTGLGLVHLAERIDVARPPRPFTDGPPPELRLPDRRQFVALSLLFLLVGSLGLIQIPVKTSQVTVSNAQSDAAVWMAEYNETNNMEWPSNYVLSEWGWNRMYNYFVNGESRSYAYAQSNFQPFNEATDPEAWYSRFRGRVGFIVTTPDEVGEPRALGTRLHRNNGAGSASSDGLAHYRLVHITGGGAYKVFTVVPGAVIQGSAPSNETVTARTNVEVGEIAFTYERSGEPTSDGRYSIRVAQPGTYAVANDTVRVNTSAVRSGSVITTG